MIKVDARGCACPEPVIMTKKAIKEDADQVEVLVDNRTALENVKRFAGKNGRKIEIEEVENYYRLILKK